MEKGGTVVPITGDAFPRAGWAGDSCYVIEFGDVIDEEINARAVAFAAHARMSAPDWVVEVVPTYRSVAVYVDSFRAERDVVAETAARWLRQYSVTGREEQVPFGIPVCYGGDFGPDLASVAAHAGIDEDEVVRLHTGQVYLVYMLGFTPGFPYLGGMNPKLETPRLDEPRVAIPAGSVGIAGKQTGIYPVESPGGWRLIGRTPLTLFDPFRDPPVLLEAGMRLRFTSIDGDRFRRIQEGKETWPQ
jgi:KipI family sensor histidine kinase inhibitor